MRRRDGGPYREATLAEKWRGWERAAGGRPLPSKAAFYAGAAALLDLVRKPTDRARRIADLGRELGEFAGDVAEGRAGG